MHNERSQQRSKKKSKTQRRALATDEIIHESLDRLTTEIINQIDNIERMSDFILEKSEAKPPTKGTNEGKLDIKKKEYKFEDDKPMLIMDVSGKDIEGEDINFIDVLKPYDSSKF